MRMALALVSLTMIFATPVAAQQVRNVEFTSGTTSNTVNGTINGNAYIDYHVRLGAGQMFAVTMTGLGRSPYFNVMEPGSSDAAIASRHGPAGRGSTRSASTRCAPPDGAARSPVTR